VVISSEIGARKPAHVTYERVCQLLAVAPEQAVYIADEEEDLAGCQAAGMFPIFIAGEDDSSSIGLRIDSLSDLLRLLQPT
jgi:FMN phosphatase YigB (HAD superfamily)